VVFQARDEKVASWNLYRYTIDIPGREVDVQRFVECGFLSERREGSELESVSLLRELYIPQPFHEHIYISG